jgi:8-oxo-dGTP pyrophosphatase MutT (NUDIX family)
VPDRHRSIVDLHLILRRSDGLILLMRRANTGYGDGQLHLPSGHLEAGESVIDAVLREAQEEVGVTVDPAELRFVHVMHRAAETGYDRVGYFFIADTWRGTPRNAEPEKCSELVWADPAELPDDTIAYPAAGIRRGLAGLACSTFGFPIDHETPFLAPSAADATLDGGCP